MIHELIDPKKTNRSGASRNLKTYQETKTVPAEIRLEGSDSENKESASTIFIPPWLRNSLGLNQKNNLSHATTGSELKPGKQSQRDKEPDQNEFAALKLNCEKDCCKKVTENFDISQQDRSQELNTGGTLDDSIQVHKHDETFWSTGSMCCINYVPDDADVAENSSERDRIPVYWDMRRRESENEWSIVDLEPLTKEDPQMAATDAVCLEIEKLKDEDKKFLKFSKQKSKLRKRLLGDSKRSDFDKDDVDLLLQMKAREALDNCMKGDFSSEMKQLEAKLLLLGAKSNALSGSKPTDQDLRFLQEMKKQFENVEDMEFFQHMKDFNLRAIGNPDAPGFKLTKERKREEKEEKCNSKDEEILKPEHDFPLSTDDENDIKRFSEFLSKNKDQEEKKKCLEEVRNYFEKKRKTRMTKHRYLEENKGKLTAEIQEKEDDNEVKMKSRDTCRGKRSKFALCGDAVVEKAVDEALHKFVELYHFRVSPSLRGSMKKSILQALSDTTKPSQKPRPAGVNPLEIGDKNPEKNEARTPPKPGTPEAEHRDTSPYKETRRKPTRLTNSKEEVSRLRLSSVTNVIEDDKLKRLKREFDVFLYSIRGNVDVSSLKLQSVILEKEDKTSKNVQLVYNFTKKALESKRILQTLKESSDSKHYRDTETQTVSTQELVKRNVKVQAGDSKHSLERYVQTEGISSVAQLTQTEGMELQEVRQLKSCDVNPGLYRMVRSTEAGKFYLYPETMECGHQLVCGDSNCSTLSEKNTENAETKIKVREVQKTKLHRGRKVSGLGIAHLRGRSVRRRLEASEHSLSCLYFRNTDQKMSGASSKKELTDENLSAVAEEVEYLKKPRKKRHVGCFWFWNGEKISAGCDLKAHVENLLQEKLTEIVKLGTHSSEIIGATKEESSQEGVRVGDTLFRVSNIRKNIGSNNLLISGNDNTYERKRRTENQSNGEGMLTIFQHEMGKNLEESNSQLKCLPANMSKDKSQLGPGLKKKSTRRNVAALRRGGSLKKAEDFLRAVEEIKKMKAKFCNSKGENTSESDSLMDESSSSSGIKNEVKRPISAVLVPEIGNISNSDVKNRLQRLMNLVDRPIQTIGCVESRDGDSTESLLRGRQMELIGKVMSKVNEKERETLWNDIREFIKTKIGKDINEEGTREVCIEIEQEMPENEHGTKNPMMAKGHYVKNEGDVEVEIDLTLEDLARLLNQKQRRSRQQRMFRTGKFKNFLSSSSASDVKHHKYEVRFEALGESLAQEKAAKLLKNKGNC